MTKDSSRDSRSGGDLLAEARALLAEIPLNAPNTIGLRAADLGGRIDAAPVSENAPASCAWYLDGEDSDCYATACGQHYVFSDGTLEECEARYCQGCGGKITLLDGRKER